MATKVTKAELQRRLAAFEAAAASAAPAAPAATAPAREPGHVVRGVIAPTTVTLRIPLTGDAVVSTTGKSLVVARATTTVTLKGASGPVTVTFTVTGFVAPQGATDPTRVRAEAVAQ